MGRRTVFAASALQNTVAKVDMVTFGVENRYPDAVTLLTTSRYRGTPWSMFRCTSQFFVRSMMVAPPPTRTAKSGMVTTSLLAEPESSGLAPEEGHPLPEKVAVVTRGAAMAAGAAGAATAQEPSVAADRAVRRTERRAISVRGFSGGFFFSRRK
jgi:hypothetical protein